MQQSDNESAPDFFAVMQKQHEEFLQRMEKVNVTDIFGIVSARGAGGAKGGDGDNWKLIIHFDGWRQQGEAMQTRKLRVEMPVSKEDLSSHMAQINAYDILHVRGRVAEHPWGRMQASVQQIVSTNVKDAELDAYAQQLQKPVVVEDPRFGVFTLDRSVNWFCGKPLWNGKTVKLNLSMDDSDSIEQLLKVARELWDSEHEWDTKVYDYAVHSLLPLKNDCWLDEEEAELSAEDFKKRMSLESITIYPDGKFEFWYDDGDLFCGHSIMVSGSLADGLDDAGIHG